MSATGVLLPRSVERGRSQEAEGELSMGFWGPGVFDNDAAADFCFDVDDAETAAEQLGVVEGLLETAASEPITLFSRMFECAAAAALIAIAVDPSVAKADFEVYGPPGWLPTAGVTKGQQDLAVSCLAALLEGKSRPTLDPAYASEIQRYLNVLARS